MEIKDEKTWMAFSNLNSEKKTNPKAIMLETTKNGYLFRDALSGFRSSIKNNDTKSSHFWLAELCISGEIKKAWNILVDHSLKVIPFTTPLEMARLYRREKRIEERILTK